MEEFLKAVKKPLNEIESPFARILLILLIAVVLYMGGVHVKGDIDLAKACETQDNKKDIKIEKQQTIIDSLVVGITTKSEWQTGQLKSEIEWKDSLIKVLQREFIINKKLK